MYRIIKIGMDVHSTNYTLCAMEPVIGAEDRIFANIKVTPDYKNVLMFIENLKLKLGLNDTYDIECGYEAGCLGYSLSRIIHGASALKADSQHNYCVFADYYFSPFK